MTNHEFKMGQFVRYTPDKTPAQTPIGIYTILRLMPTEDNDQQYRIKNMTEPFERSARVSQLADAQRRPT